MAVGKEIRGKIKSVENTKKITKAMEMVAASKMRKAQDRMRAARPYSEKVRNIAAHLGQANPEYVHPFMKTHPAKSTGFIVVTTDKGLCGGMNTNILRALTQKFKDMQALEDAGDERTAQELVIHGEAQVSPGHHGSCRAQRQQCVYGASRTVGYSDPRCGF